ncbi:MAG: flagellar protein [Clostridiales bacterium]|nr:flagellar protein [Clostridiales bacterium]
MKDYIRENPGCNTAEVSAFCDVSVPQIERWIREERLSFSSESQVGLPCERCGTMIKSGRYCERCRVEVIRDLTDVYSVTKPEKKKKREDNKMRYIGDE